MALQHGLAFRDVPGVEMAGVSSRTKSRAEDLARSLDIECVADSVAELCERSAADLVVVAVSVENMAEVAHRCLEHPWQLLLEKPPGLDLSEAEEILSQARSLDREVYVALNRRFMASTREVATRMDSHDGARWVSVLDQQDRREALTMGFPQRVVDNFMFANSIHLVDYIRLFCRGDLERVVNLSSSRRAQGVSAAYVEFSSGDAASYQALWERPGPWSVSVSLPQARWEIRPLERATEQLYGHRTTTELPSHVFDQSFKPGFRLQAEEVIRAVRGVESDVVRLEEAVETMRLIDGIYRA